MHPDSQSSIDRQLKASAPIVDAVIAGLTNERGVHAETAVAATARMAGTCLFRSFNLPTGSIAPGSPVLSDLANEQGPRLVEVMQAGLTGLGIELGNDADMQEDPDHRPLLAFLETQHLLEPAILAITASHDLKGETAARACALATALMIHRTRSVLDPSIGFGLAVYGIVEGTRTMPAPVAHPEPASGP